MNKTRTLFCLLCFVFIFQSIGLASDRQAILRAMDGTYSVNYHVRGQHLDALKKCYRDKVTIKDGRLNGWALNIENAAKSANNEYTVICTYILEGYETSFPMVEAKLSIELSDDNTARKIEHQNFISARWPNDEWKTTMTFYRID